DRVGSEIHPLSGQAKDIASAAVFLSLMLCGMTWLTILTPVFF
ncbi:MAG: diacylglycerol kinase, partial [Shewanella sp.]